MDTDMGGFSDGPTKSSKRKMTITESELCEALLKLSDVELMKKFPRWFPNRKACDKFRKEES